MKKIALLLLTLIMGFAPIQLWAQLTLTVADGTETNDHIPLYGFYMDSYIHSQFVYPESMLVDMAGGGIIEQMMFYTSESSVGWTSTVVVKIGVSPTSSLSSFSTEPTSTVYTGTLSVNANHMTIVFDSSFTYTSGNLLIDLYTTTKGNYVSAHFYGISSTGASIAGYNYENLNAISPSGWNFLPKTTFTYLPASISCYAPASINIENLIDTNAIVTWPSSADGENYILQYKNSTQSWDSAVTVNTNSTSYNFSGILSPATSYDVRIATICDNNDTSLWRTTSFTTIQTPVELPYNAQFNEDDLWVLNNGNCVNYWAAGQVPGRRALFITNDGMIPTYTFTSPSAVSAEKNIIIGNAAQIIVSFDLNCGGESSYDYLKVFLSPMSTEYPAASSPLPTWSGKTYGTYAVDFSSYTSLTGTPAGNPYIINLTNNTYVHFDLILDNPIQNPSESSLAKLVFGWHNDNSSGATPGAVISNLQIMVPQCQMTSLPQVSNISSFTADLSWEIPTEDNNFIVQYAVDGTDWDDSTVVSIPTTGTSLSLTGLVPATNYQVRVATDCDNITSIWQSTSFSTPPTCTPPTHVTFSQIAGTSAIVSWEQAPYGALNYTVNYSEEGQSTWVSQNTSNTSLILSSLQPNTTYNVTVYSNCEIGSADTIQTNFTTSCLVGGSASIGNGTNAMGIIPSYGLYNYSYSQQLFTSGEIGGARSIKSIAFNVNTFETQRTFQIYLMHTTASNVATGIATTNAQQVFAGSTNFTSGWSTINFTTPFAYNGSDNLLLIVIDATGSWNSNYNSWMTHEAFPSCTYYAYQDASPYNINSLPTGGNALNVRNNVVFGSDCDTTATCIAPNAYISDVTSTSITVTWAAGYTENEWQLEYSIDNQNWIPMGSVTSPYTINELDPSTQYYVRLRSVCGTSNFSAWGSILSTFTLCSTISVTPNEPFTEDFNTLSEGIPSCWNNDEGTTSTSDYRWNYYEAGESGACVRFNSFYNPDGMTNMLKTPVLDLSTLTHPIINFDYLNPAGGDLSVFLSTDGGLSYNTAITTGLANTSDWTEVLLDLPDMTNAENVVIVFQATSNYGVGDAYISLDNVYVGDMVTCPKPQNLTATTSTTNSITLSWTLGNEESSWEILYGTSGFNPETEGVVIPNVTSNPYEVTGLDNTTTYDFYVRANCGDNVSSWSKATSYSTIMVPDSLPYSTNFSTANWKLNNGTCGNRWKIGIPSDNANTSLFITNDNQTAQYKFTKESVVSAEKLFNMNDRDSVNITFDVTVGGESTFDYLKVFFAPSNVQYEPSESQTIYSPSEYSTHAVNFQNYLSQTNYSNAEYPYKLNLTNNSLHISVNMPNPDPNGQAKLVFVWRNDPSIGTQPGAIIENVGMEYVDVEIPIPPTCDMPSNINTDNISQNSADVSWTAGGDETAWNLQYKNAADAEWSNSIAVNTTPAYHFTGLSAQTTYQVRVQANCGDTTSDWTAPASFTTPAIPVEICNTPTGLTITNITQNSATMSWTAGGDEFVWKVGYKNVTASVWQEATVAATNYTIEGLSPETAYDVRVKAVCSATNESDFATDNFTTTPDAINDVSLANSINLMPNPADNYIELSINSSVEVTKAMVYNAFGQILQTIQLTDNHARIDLSKMAAGMYFVRVNGENATATKKFIKK